MYFALIKDRVASTRKIIAIFIIACFYGIAMEYVQKYFIPGRDFDVYDMVADAIGAVGGWIVFRVSVSWLKAPQE